MSQIHERRRARPRLNAQREPAQGPRIIPEREQRRDHRDPPPRLQLQRRAQEQASPEARPQEPDRADLLDIERLVVPPARRVQRRIRPLLNIVQHAPVAQPEPRRDRDHHQRRDKIWNEQRPRLLHGKIPNALFSAHKIPRDQKENRDMKRKHHSRDIMDPQMPQYDTYDRDPLCNIHKPQPSGRRF